MVKYILIHICKYVGGNCWIEHMVQDDECAVLKLRAYSLLSYLSFILEFIFLPHRDGNPAQKT